MSKPDWDDAMEKATKYRDGKGTAWSKAPKQKPAKNPNKANQYDFKPLIGKNQHFEGNDARRASRDMRKK